MISSSISHIRLPEKDIIFIYPDMRTVLVGQFEDGIMIQGRSAKIIAERCNDGIKEIKFALPHLSPNPLIVP